MYLRLQLKTLLYVRELAKVLIYNPCNYCCCTQLIELEPNILLTFLPVLKHWAGSSC